MMRCFAGGESAFLIKRLFFDIGNVASLVTIRTDESYENPVGIKSHFSKVPSDNAYRPVRKGLNPSSRLLVFH